MRGVGGADNYQQWSTYRLGDPWNMDSGLEQAVRRHNALVGAPSAGRQLLEIGCGEGLVTACSRSPARSTASTSVSDPTGRAGVPGARFAADIAGQPWGQQARRFDLLARARVLYHQGHRPRWSG